MMAISAELIKALMNGEVGTYYQNPFARQEEINKATLDKALEESLLKKKQIDLGGMFTGGSSDSTPTIDPAVLAALEAENSTARGQRNLAFMDMLGGNRSMENMQRALGLTDSMGGVTPSRVAQMANIYGRTPSMFQSFLPDSYGNAFGFMNQNDSIFNNMRGDSGSPLGVTMGSQQSAALAAQDLGLFDSPEERAAWYAANSGGDSSVSAAEQAGLDAAQSSFGYGSNADYFGD